MDELEVGGDGLVGEGTARAAIGEERPTGPIDFAIPYIRRKPFFSFDIEYWALVFSGGAFYAANRTRQETVTEAGALIDGSVDDLIDVARGRIIKRDFKQAVEGGLQDVLSLAHETHRLTPTEMAGIRTRRGLFRFRIMFPAMGERKKFSLVAWNKYRKGFMQNLEKSPAPV